MVFYVTAEDDQSLFSFIFPDQPVELLHFVIYQIVGSKLITTKRGMDSWVHKS